MRIVIAYGLTRFRRGGELAFARRSDKILLAIIALIAGLGLASIVTSLPAEPGDIAVAVAVFALCGCLSGYRVRIVLNALATRSVIAPAALATLRRPRKVVIVSLMAGCLMSAIFVSVISGRLSGTDFAAAVATQASCFALAYSLAGRIAATEWQRIIRRRHSRRIPAETCPSEANPQTIIGRFQIPFAHARELFVAGGLGLLAGLARPLANLFSHSILTSVFAGIAALVVAAAVSRVSPAICRYSCYLGLPLAQIVWAHCRLLSMAATATVALSLSLGMPWETIAFQAAVYGAMLYLTVVRILHYRQFSKSRSNLLLQIELCAIALSSVLLPPLGIALILIIPSQLVRREPNVRWMA